MGAMRRRHFLRAIFGGVAALPLLRWLPERVRDWPRVWACDVSEHGFTLVSRITETTAQRLIGELKVQMTLLRDIGAGWEQVDCVEQTITDR